LVYIKYTVPLLLSRLFFIHYVSLAQNLSGVQLCCSISRRRFISLGKGSWLAYKSRDIIQITLGKKIRALKELLDFI
jgi:hypothetical protein